MKQRKTMLLHTLLILSALCIQTDYTQESKANKECSDKQKSCSGYDHQDCDHKNNICNCPCKKKRKSMYTRNEHSSKRHHNKHKEMDDQHHVSAQDSTEHEENEAEHDASEQQHDEHEEKEEIATAIE